MEAGGRSGSDERAAERLMDQHLRSIGLMRKRVAKDGSCLFRAVAEQVLHSQSLHTVVRAQCVDFLRRNREVYEAFMEGDFEDYLHRIQDPQEWVGEVEINALASIYKKDFLIYQEAGKPAVNITDNKYQDKVRLCFLNGNHYDIVYPASRIRNAAVCQSILYELLYNDVFKVDRSLLAVCQRASRPGDQPSDDSMAACVSSDDSDAETSRTETERNANNNGRSGQRARGRGRQLPERVRRSLNPTLLRNVEYDLWQKSKRAQQKMDYCIAAGMHFTVGDRCQVRLENSGRSYSATVKEVPENNSQVTVYIEELGNRRVPLWCLRPPSDESSWTSVVNRRLNNGEREEKGRGRGRGKAVSQATTAGPGVRASRDEPGRSGRKPQSRSEASFGLSEEERQAREEEERNVALVEITFRDELSFPALGTQTPTTNQERGRKRGGEKRRSQGRQTKGPVEDDQPSSPSSPPPPPLTSSSSPPPPPPSSLPPSSSLPPALAPPAMTSLLGLRSDASPKSPPQSYASVTVPPLPTPSLSFLTPVLPPASPSSSSSSCMATSTPTFIAPSPTSLPRPPSPSLLPRPPSPSLLPRPPSPSPTSLPRPPSPSLPPAVTEHPAVIHTSQIQNRVRISASHPETRGPPSQTQNPPAPQHQEPPNKTLHQSLPPEHQDLVPSGPAIQTQSPAAGQQNQDLCLSGTGIQTQSPAPAPQHQDSSLSRTQVHSPVLVHPHHDTTQNLQTEAQSSPPASPPPPPPSSLLPPPAPPPQQPDSPVPPPSQETHPPHPAPPPQLLPGAVPLQQVSQLYQDLLYPGFPVGSDGDLAPTPPYASSRAGDDLPRDVNVLRFFFNLGVKAYTNPMCVPYLYLVPLLHTHAHQPQRPPSTPNPPPISPDKHPESHQNSPQYPTAAPSTPQYPTAAPSTPQYPTAAPSAPQYPTAASSTPQYPMPPSTPQYPTTAPSTSQYHTSTAVTSSSQYPTTAPSIPQYPTAAPSTPQYPTAMTSTPQYPTAPSTDQYPAAPKYDPQSALQYPSAAATPQYLGGPQYPADPQYDPQAPPHHPPWQQTPTPRNPGYPVRYPSSHYPILAPSPQGYPAPGHLPPHPPSSLGYPPPFPPGDLQAGRGGTEPLQPANGGLMLGHGRFQGPGPLEVPHAVANAANNSRAGTTSPSFAGRDLSLISRPTALVSDSGPKPGFAASSPASQGPYKTRTPLSHLPPGPLGSGQGGYPGRGSLGLPAPGPGGYLGPTQGGFPVHGQGIFMARSVGCGTEDEETERFKQTTLNYRGRRGYRAGGGSRGRAGSRRRYGDTGAGLNPSQFIPTHRGRGPEGGY